MFLEIEACNFIKKETLAQVFSCESCEISKKTFFLRTPLVDTCHMCTSLQITRIIRLFEDCLDFLKIWRTVISKSKELFEILQSSVGAGDEEVNISVTQRYRYTIIIFLFTSLIFFSISNSFLLHFIQNYNYFYNFLNKSFEKTLQDSKKKWFLQKKSKWFLFNQSRTKGCIYCFANHYAEHFFSKDLIS